MEPRYKLRDLAREADIGLRTLRSYIKRGALPRPPHRGPLPAYDAAFLTRLKAAVRLRRQGVEIDQLHGRLSAASPAEILYLAGEGPAPVPAEVEAIPKLEQGSRPTEGGTEAWERTVLHPGLELHLKAGSDEAVQRMARAIRTMFGAAEGNNR